MIGCCWDELQGANKTFGEDRNSHYLNCHEGFTAEYFDISKLNKLYILNVCILCQLYLNKDYFLKNKN